jgi:hypothetical protein
MDVPLRCACGSLRGVLRSVTPRDVNRCICYCDDCQSFAFFLQRAGSILDAHGGTEVCQTSPARLEITAGEELLECVQLRTRSRLVRWYAGCCRTPIGNTPATPRLPFVSVIHGCVDLAATRSSADAVLGPVRGGFFRRFSRGDHADLDGRLPALPFLRLARIVLAARLRRDQLRSPFFQPTGDLRVAPRVLSAEELRAVEATRDSSSPQSSGIPPMAGPPSTRSV